MPSTIGPITDGDGIGEGVVFICVKHGGNIFRCVLPRVGKWQAVPQIVEIFSLSSAAARSFASDSCHFLKIQFIASSRLCKRPFRCANQMVVLLYLQDSCNRHCRNDLSSFLLALLQGLADRNPDAAFVIRALHIAGGVHLQHSVAVAKVFLPFLRIPLLPDPGVQGLQGAGQRLPGGEHGSVAFGEGVQLQALRHFAALIEASDPVLAATSKTPSAMRNPIKTRFPVRFLTQRSSFAQNQINRCKSHDVHHALYSKRVYLSTVFALFSHIPIAKRVFLLIIH